LENAFADDGEQIIKVLEDPRIKDAAAELRERTRIGTDENGIKIDEMLGKAIRYARANFDSRKEFEIELEAVTSTTVTTDVDSIRKVLNCIMHSMLKNTKGNKIAVAASIKETASGEDFNRYEITVRDNSDVSFDIDPTREFVNGKLKRALQLANGLCDYHFEAQFKGKRALVNMHSGKKGRSCKSDTKGVVHRLGFWIPKPPTEKENDNSQERPGTRNQQRDGLGSESKKVLKLARGLSRRRSTSLRCLMRLSPDESWSWSSRTRFKRCRQECRLRKSHRHPTERQSSNLRDYRKEDPAAYSQESRESF
jgi:hypothetical protein